jgi:hypothetical protein
MEFYSSNEYWVKAGSLMSTDPTGKFDLPDQPEASALTQTVDSQRDLGVRFCGDGPSLRYRQRARSRPLGGDR